MTPAEMEAWVKMNEERWKLFEEQEQLVFPFFYSSYNAKLNYQVSRECEHDFQKYVGFTQAYEFCTKCDVTKEMT